MNHIKERNEVLAAAREISASGLVTGTWGNVSVRIANQSLMGITPSGMDYNSLNVEDIVLVDFEQQVVEGEYQPSVETPLHLKIYKKRPEAMAVVHVHSPFATAFAVARKNIPVILEETAQAVGHEIGVAAYAHCGTPQLADNVVKALGATRQAVLLANHGLVAVGETMDQALKICYVVEKTARVAIYARSLGPAHSLSQEDINFLRSSFEHYGQAHK